MFLLQWQGYFRNIWHLDKFRLVLNRFLGLRENLGNVFSYWLMNKSNCSSLGSGNLYESRQVHKSTRFASIVRKIGNQFPWFLFMYRGRVATAIRILKNNNPFPICQSFLRSVREISLAWFVPVSMLKERFGHVSLIKWKSQYIEQAVHTDFADSMQ